LHAGVPALHASTRCKHMPSGQTRWGLAGARWGPTSLGVQRDATVWGLAGVRWGPGSRATVWGLAGIRWGPGSRARLLTGAGGSHAHCGGPPAAMRASIRRPSHQYGGLVLLTQAGFRLGVLTQRGGREDSGDGAVPTAHTRDSYRAGCREGSALPSGSPRGRAGWVRRTVGSAH
jgi:hypothetical protein